MKNFKEYLKEKSVNEDKADMVSEDDMISMTKDEVLNILDNLSEETETDLEDELIDLISSLIEEDIIIDYDMIVDMVEEFLDDEDDDDMVEEAQRPLYKRRGYVKDPRTGRIRKRGNLGKPLDRKRSRLMKKARKKHKMSFKKAQRKTRRTKKRLGQIK